MEKKQYKPIGLKRKLRIGRLYSLHYFKYSKSFRFEGEAHDFWEFIYCDSGEVRIHDNGTEYILKEGEGFLHPPNNHHSLMPNNKFANAVIVSFDGQLNELFCCTGKPIILDKGDVFLLKTIIKEGKEAFSEPLNIVYQFELKPSEKGCFGCLQIIQNCLENLMISLYRKAVFPESSAVRAAAKTQSEGLAYRILDILSGSIREPLRIQDISRKLNYSPTYLKTVFKATMGTSIIQYFIALKIEQAKRLLSETSYTITQIAEMLGFDSVQYFSRQFKKITNMTPTAYLGSVSAGVL